MSKFIATSHSPFSAFLYVNEVHQGLGVAVQARPVKFTGLFDATGFRETETEAKEDVEVLTFMYAAPDLDVNPGANVFFSGDLSMRPNGALWLDAHTVSV